MSSKPQPQCKIICEGADLFVIVEGVKIAKLGEPGTPQRWVPLEPGWRVLEGKRKRNGTAELVIEHQRVRVQ